MIRFVCDRIQSYPLSSVYWDQQYIGLGKLQKRTFILIGFISVLLSACAQEADDWGAHTVACCGQSLSWSMYMRGESLRTGEAQPWYGHGYHSGVATHKDPEKAAGFYRAAA